MNFPIVSKYQQQFPNCSSLIESFETYYNKKLWNQLTLAILKFLYLPQVKGKVEFDFYTEFVKKFEKRLQNNVYFHQKVQKQSNLIIEQQIIQFLKQFEQKHAFTQQTKTIVYCLSGLIYIDLDFSKCSELWVKTTAIIQHHKDIDSFVYSIYYKFCMRFYTKKQKYKQFYTNSLQFMAYTNQQELESSEKIIMLKEMAISVLVAKNIYNFSQLLQQPLLKSLQQSQYKQLYTILQIFNRGAIGEFESLNLHSFNQLETNKVELHQKIRIMALLEMVFNLPKNNRVINFETVAKQCDIAFNNVEKIVMKAMSLNLIRGSIDQIHSLITISWIMPKVLENQRIGTMLNKFELWQKDVSNISQIMNKEIKV